MTATRTPSRLTSPGAAALASLVPLVAYLAAIAVADRGVEQRSVPLIGLVAAAPVYLGFVSLPSLLPLLAARTAGLRLFAVLVMTGVAGTAGVLVVTTDDAQAGLAVLIIPYVAIPLAGVLWVASAVVAARRPLTVPPTTEVLTPAEPSDRLAALAIDVTIVGGALIVPLTAMSHAGQEVIAGIVGVGVATAYFAALVAGRGRTVGQSLLGLAVVDARTLRRVPPGRALLRSLVVVLEVAGTPTLLLAAPAIAELVSTLHSGRSITDKVLKTSVVRRRAPPAKPVRLD